MGRNTRNQRNSGQFGRNKIGQVTPCMRDGGLSTPLRNQMLEARQGDGATAALSPQSTHQRHCRVLPVLLPELAEAGLSHVVGDQAERP